MQMGTGGNTGAAHITDQLALGHGLSGVDNVMGHVHINGGKAVAVVDGNIVARATGLIGGGGDLTGTGGIDGSAGGTGQVDL